MKKDQDTERDDLLGKNVHRLVPKGHQSDINEDTQEKPDRRKRTEDLGDWL